jgi:hypothetical protein
MALDDERKPEATVARPTAPVEQKPSLRQAKKPQAEPRLSARQADDPFADEADVDFDLLDEDEPDDVDIFDRDTKIPSLPSEELAAEAMRRLDDEEEQQQLNATYRPQLATPVVDPPDTADASLLDELAMEEYTARGPAPLTRDSEPSWRDQRTGPPRTRSQANYGIPSNPTLDFADFNAAPLNSLAPNAGLEAPSAAIEEAPEPSAEEMQERYAVGDFTRALEIAEALLLRRPDDASTRRCAQNCRDVLTQMFAARIGPLDQVMTVIISPHEVQWLSLDHRAGFLLSLVDGQSTVDEILDISGMSRLDALKIIHQLVEQQVVSLA